MRALLVAALTVALAGCAVPGGSTDRAPMFAGGQGAIVVAAAENFYADVVHQVGGDHVTVYSFLSDPNADPHEFESSAADARAVADARLVVENGLGYDAFMDRLLRASPRGDRTIINVQRLAGAAAGANPHLWYDPAVMPRVAEAAAGALAGLDAAHAEDYKANLQRFAESLAPLSGKVAELRGRYRGTPVAFTEPVAAYLAAALELDVRSPKEFTKAVEEGTDPPAAATAAEEDLLTGRRVRVLIYNRQTITKVTGTMRDLARQNGIPVVGFSETEPPGTDFQTWQLAQLSALEVALGA